MKISIITVCLNSVATLGSTFESIAAQRHPDIEHIVVDGGSTDGTLELIEAWRGHPFTLVRGPDDGIYDAMNKGVARATGDVVGFLNSDDRYADDDVLADIGRAMSPPAVEFCHGDLVFRKIVSREVTRYWIGAPFTRTKFLFGWLPAHPTLYVRRAVMAHVGPFSLAYRVSGDIEWMLRLLSRPGPSSVYIPRVLVEMDTGGVSNAGPRAFLGANRDVWRACRALRLGAARFVVGKTLRKVPQWFRTWQPPRRRAGGATPRP